MVLEYIISVKNAERRPWKMFFLGLIYTSVAIPLSLWIFPSQASATAILFVVIASLPLVLSLFRHEESEAEAGHLKHHKATIPFFVFFFLGLVLAFTLWNIFLPNSLSTLLFAPQENTIAEITGDAVAQSAGFVTILLNNFKVLAIAVILSLLYGAGAVFIFTWNASVIASAVGAVVKNLGHAAIGTGLLKYLLHGVPEITAYFMGGLAGGIISFAIVRHKFGTKRFYNALIDSADLTIAAVVLLVVSAFLEISISPLI
ncbi:MAG: stage II sporulation protein M [DPANN group archaeon]|nr:stage II sporulation protein M [DPANN group archaeon]